MTILQKNSNRSLTIDGQSGDKQYLFDWFRAYKEIRYINQNTSALTAKEINQLIKQLEKVIASVQLPDQDNKSIKRDIEAIEAELVTEEPDKEEVKFSLESITRKINKLGKTVDAAKQLGEKTAPILRQIGPWLSVAATHFF